MYKKIFSKLLKKYLLIPFIIIIPTIITTIFLLVGNYVNSASDPSCNNLQSGDLVRLENDAYWFYLDSNKKLIQTSSHLQSSWGKVSLPKVIKAKCFDSLEASTNNVNYRPGTYLIKYRNSDQLYAILPGNKFAPISSNIAQQLYKDYKAISYNGLWWMTVKNKIKPITQAIPHPGMLVSSDNKNTIYYVDENSTLHLITNNGFTVNNFYKKFIRDINQNVLKQMKVGTTIDALLPHLIDKTQNTAPNYPTSTPIISVSNTTTIKDNTSIVNPKPILTPTSTNYGATYYIRTDGGTTNQCDGKTNKAVSTNGHCAWSHPFIALPPDGTAKIAGGDTLVIGNGSYQMGAGAPGTKGVDKCNINWSYDCIMANIPSGPNKDKPTKIVGADYANGCNIKPELWGSGRPWTIIEMNGSDNVELQCLEITDHSSCVESHSGDIACNRNNAPFGPWASIGLRAQDSKNVLLKNLDIHGLAHTGIQAGRLTDWIISKTKIQGNGWVGWDGDIIGNDSNNGIIKFSYVNIDWNGCGETYPGKQPTGCWGQSAGGYGDGLGTGATGGNWILEDSTFLHNTSDGLDLLYHRNGGTIAIRRVHAEGNAGNQIKVEGNATVSDSVIIGNCGYFDNKSFTHNVDPCRALGDTIVLETYTSTVPTKLFNNSIFSNGNIVVLSDGGGTIDAYNNIFYGGVNYHNPSEISALFYSDTGSTFKHSYNLAYNTKNQNLFCSSNNNDICGSNPMFSLIGNNFDLQLQNNSPALNRGIQQGISNIDITGKNRIQGKNIDMGAYEN